MTDRLRIAASQFPVSGDRRRNARYIAGHIERAAADGAHIVNFPETALPGYPPRHHPTLTDYDWVGLDRETERVRTAAEAHGVWVLLGTMRRDESGAIRSSVLVISDTGATVAVYDKRRLYGRELNVFSAGDRACIFTVRGVRCGVLICYDNCFPDLYAEYRDLGIEVLFHAFYNARNSRVTSIADLMAANLIVRAADHGFWISASNSSEAFSPLRASIVRPDGSAVRAKRHVASVVVADHTEEVQGWTYVNRVGRAG